MGNDHARASDLLGIGATTNLSERSFGTTVWTVDRFDADQTDWAGVQLARAGRFVQPTGADFASLGVRPYSTTEVVGNLITNAGWTRLMSLLTATGGTQALTATSVRIGVGNGVTAETYTDTDLAASAGSTNRYFQPVSGAASLGTRTTAFAATFGTADGNFSWSEFCLDIGTPTVTGGATVAALMFNRKAGIAQGTKAAGQTWTATATITFS